MVSKHFRVVCIAKALYRISLVFNLSLKRAHCLDTRKINSDIETFQNTKLKKRSKVIPLLDKA